jgi:hypothetical protein
MPKVTRAGVRMMGVAGGAGTAFGFWNAGTRVFLRPRRSAPYCTSGAPPRGMTRDLYLYVDSTHIKDAPLP